MEIVKVVKLSDDDAQRVRRFNEELAEAVQIVTELKEDKAEMIEELEYRYGPEAQEGIASYTSMSLKDEFLVFVRESTKGNRG